MRLEAPIGSVARAKKRYVSVTEHFSGLVSRGVELRVLLASSPSRPFRESLAKWRSLQDTRAWLRQCPRVHLKLIVVDGAELYLGSANFTGAGMGARGDSRRNFELGVTTSDHVLVDAAQRRFDRIWSGGECKGCRVPRQMPGTARRAVSTPTCSDPPLMTTTHPAWVGIYASLRCDRKVLCAHVALGSSGAPAARGSRRLAG